MTNINGLKTNILEQIIHVSESPWLVQQTDKEAEYEKSLKIIHMSYFYYNFGEIGFHFILFTSKIY